MESVFEALERALVIQTNEAWEHVDRLAYIEVNKGQVDAHRMKALFSIALKRLGFDPTQEDDKEASWIDLLLAKSLESLERCASTQACLSSIPSVMHSIDRSGRLIAVTRPWLDMLGYRSMNDVVGRRSSEFLTEDSKKNAISTALPRFWRDGYIRDWPYQMVRSDGRVIDVIFDAICTRDDTGDPISSLCTIRKKHPII